MNTIAAISTPAGNGGIGIIRISGSDVLTIIDRIFVPVKNGDWKPFSFKLGKIIDESQEPIDQVLVSYFKSPKSYTGEDVCEINCHGGSIVLQKILELVLRSGATLAMPGEFTKRAFMNGKLDLTQVEAVMELIHSKSEKEEKASMKQLEGKLGEKIRNIKNRMIDLLADIEANIDYPEYEDIEDVRREKIIKILQEASEQLSKLERSFDSGKILKNGISTAIIGKPNVGKSSLLNVLLKEDRAIVTEIPGTTRDTIEEYISMRGISLRLIDTAGIRETDDIVENIGVEKSKQAIKDAELILFLLDGNGELSEDEIKLYQMIKDKPHIIIINKIDLGEEKIDLTPLCCDFSNLIRISAKTEIGLEALEDKIEDLFQIKNMETENELIITNIRHRDLITKTIFELGRSIHAISGGLPIDMASIDIQSSIKNLGEILGESISEDVLNRIFEKFCVGK